MTELSQGIREMARVEALARTDAHEIIWQACHQGAINEAAGDEGRILLVSGTHIAPSTRALPHGQATWDMPDIGNEQAHIIYVEEFDRVIETHNGVRDDGRSIYWDEGDLWLTSNEEEEDDQP